MTGVSLNLAGKLMGWILTSLVDAISSPSGAPLEVCTCSRCCDCTSDLRMGFYARRGFLCKSLSAKVSREKIFLAKSVEFRLEPLRYYNFLPNNWSEFKLSRKTHGLSLNLTGWCCFKSQRCTSRGVYMLATLRLYQRRQNGVLCTEGISLQVAIRASTKVEKRFFSSTSRDL